METFSFLPKSSLNASVLSHIPNLGPYLHLNQSSIHFSKRSQLYQQLVPARETITTLLDSVSFSQLIIFILCTAWAVGPVIRKRPAVTNAVYHGYRSWLEPTFLVQSRYILFARDIISSGYRKYRETPFVVRRWDTDITILPNKYLNELRLYPPSKLSGVKAQVANLVHRWTYTTLMIESNLHFRVLQNKLTAELSKYLDIAKTELAYGWDQDIPQPEEWLEVDIQNMMRMCVARMSAKIFMGYPACRDHEWLKLSIDFSIDLFACAFLFRMFPPFLHPIVGPFLPPRWAIRRNLKKAKKIIGPLMLKHRECVRRREAGETGPEVEEDDTLLNWMMDNGNEKENRLEEMATRQSILTLASIHTTSMGVANILFDLCAHPEWFPVLREEIAEVEKDFGKLGERPEIGTKQWLPRLEKMDSFFIESQRFNPPILLAPSRLAIVPITLKDGTHIPAGTRLACANADILSDSVPDPETFDPMRSYRKRYETGELNKHQAGQTEKENLHFGYGKQACPGRWFAIGEIKMVLVRLLSEYEFKYPEGKTRPRNFFADENVFPDPRARLLMRKRRPVCEKCGRS